MYKNIGILRNLGLGDSIVYTPFLRKLRALYPQAKITVYTGKNKVSDLFFKRIPYIDEVIAVDAQANIFQKIFFGIKNFKKHDLFIDTIESTKIGGIFSRILGKTSVGFSHSGYHTFNIDSNTLDKDMSIIQKEFLIFEKLGHTVDMSPEICALDFPIQESDKEGLLQKLGTNDILSQTYVCIHPSSDPRFLSKKWEIAKWEKVIDFIVFKGYKIVIIGTNEDEVYIEGIKNNNILKLNKFNLNIWETGIIIKKSFLYIGLNSGPARISAAFNIKSIILNGTNTIQRDFKENIFKNTTNIRGWYAQGDCYHNPCDLFECKYNKGKIGLCMKNISSDQIIEKINEIL